ncbi:AAA family ATPase [Vibrio harveyi]|uniref:AAA family ATPase n=1 Tax=Vibrio harveyi TaxID=669 RepID=UPI00406932AA
MKIRKVELQAFKSYLNKEDGTFDFTLPNGMVANLVCIYAPNGFGKTSFYDAVDYGITRNITRYIRNQSTRVFNSKIADAIGKFSKQQETPESQYVLRTRGAPDNIDTTISINTTVGNFFEKIDKPRKNNKDYQFDDSNTPEDRAFFREVMLSQEAIDSFLREDKAELRYSQFMEFQPTKVRVIDSERQVITRIINDIGKKEKLLNKEIIDLEAKISSFEISNETRDKASSLYDSLTEKGYDIPEINDEYDELQKNEKQLLVTLEKSRITKELEKLECEASVISDNRNNLRNAILKINEQAKVGELTSKVQERIDKVNLYSRHNDDLTKINKEYVLLSSKCELIFLKLSDLDRFEYVLEKQGKRKRITNELEMRLNEAIKNRSNKKASKNLLLEQFSSSTESLQKLNKRINNIDATYNSIEENNQLLNAYRLRKRKLEESISQNTKSLHAVHDTVSKLNDITFETDSWIYQDSFSNEEVGIDLTELDIKSKEKRKIQLKLNTIESLLSKFLRRGEQLSHLIDDGLNFINLDENKDLTLCPVCTADHKTHSNLCKAITSNSLLGDKEKDLQGERSTLLSVLHEINAEYDKARSAAKLYIESKLKDAEYLKNSLSKEGIELSAELESLKSKISLGEETIYRLQMETQGIDKNSLKKLYEDNRENKERSNVIIAGKINQLDIDLNDINNVIEITRLELSSNIESEDDASFYIDYMNFLSDMSLDISSLNVVESIKKIKQELKSKLSTFNEELDKILIKKESVINDIKNIEKSIDGLSIERVRNIKDLENKSLAKLNERLIYLNSENRAFIDFCLINELESQLKTRDFNGLNLGIEKLFKNINAKIISTKQGLSDLELFNEMIEDLYAMFAKTRLSKELSELNLRFTKMNEIKDKLESDLDSITNTLKSLVDGYFYKELINKVYEKIDPHPEFKEIKFECSFPDNSSPQLNVFVQKEESTDFISPNLSFSSAQISVLSLSIFLARAINNKGYDGKPCECIFIDDPIQSMDSINILSTIDLLRNVSFNLDRQIVISTHDENFFELMKVKLPLGKAKFFSLVSYGRVEESIVD